MNQERRKDKEHDVKGMKKATALILERCWEKGYAAGFDDGYKTGRSAGPFIGKEGEGE